jgi:hypothetical protein
LSNSSILLADPAEAGVGEEFFSVFGLSPHAMKTDKSAVAPAVTPRLPLVIRLIQYD